MASRAATLLSVILFIAFGLELVAVLSEPITKSITLCSYGKYNFGVFGYCNTETGECSSVQIGYDEGISLPSSARSSLSKLLVVHVVAAALTFMLFICALLSHVFHSSGGFLLAVLILMLPAFLISLLAFLVDILLFVGHLNWAGWLVLVSTVIIAFSGIVMCLMRRSLSSRNAAKRRSATIAQDQSELQNLSVFNSTTALTSVPGGYASSNLKEPEFTELKYETSAGTGISGEEERMPLRSAGGVIETNEYANVSNMSTDGVANDTLDSLNQPPATGYRGYEPTPISNMQHQQQQQPQYGSDYGNPAPARQRRQRPRRAASPPRETIPAGSYVPGLEQEREEGYGPNVVPVPKLRPESPPIQQVHTDLSQSSLHNQPLPMDPKDDIPPVPQHQEQLQQQQQPPLPLQQQQRRPSGPRMPRGPPSNQNMQQYNDQQDLNNEYVAPRSQWNQGRAVAVVQEPPADYVQRARSPPVPIEFSPQAYRDGATSPESSRQKLRQYFVEENGNNNGGYQPPQQYNDMGYQGYAVSSGPAPVPVNQGFQYGSSPHSAGRQYGEGVPDTSYGQPMAQAHYYQTSPPPSVQAQPKAKSDGVLESNPDFKLNVPPKRGGAQRANRNKAVMSPHAFSEGPYGFK